MFTLDNGELLLVILEYEELVEVFGMCRLFYNLHLPSHIEFLYVYDGTIAIEDKWFIIFDIDEESLISGKIDLSELL